jgi:CPA2 family monovalent cation:H+ antiporter-2
LAGLLLAETEYRRQIEVLIEPFKGLLLGVFLISMGMTIDLGVIFEAPIVILGLSLALIAIKTAIVFGLTRWFGASPRISIQTALLAAPGGEFSFVILTGAAALGVLSERAADLALIAAGLTMASIPLMSLAGRAIGRRMAPAQVVDPALLAPTGLAETPRVIIAGYGRVGEVAADLLRKHKVEFLAIDGNPDVVFAARKKGAPVYYGDATNKELLRRCGLATARALVATMDAPVAVEEVVAAARAEREDLVIVARARDARHAASLYAKGASDAVPETVEASLLLAETLLVDIGVPTGPVIASVHDRRAEFRAEIQKLAPDAEVRAPPRRLISERRKS